MSRWFRVYDDLVDDPKVQMLKPALFKVLVNLWCLASQNGGIFPHPNDIAFKLRMRGHVIDDILEELQNLGLVDTDETGTHPHNWASRQYQSDSSAERVKRHREKRASLGLVRQWAPTKELRVAVYTRDEFQCVYCGGTDDLTIDHRVPEGRGGTHDLDNLQTACRVCNAQKRDLTHDEYTARNADETLPKRPQNTEAENRTDSEKKEFRPKRVRTVYSEEFENEFWKAYPRTPIMSKVQAFTEWIKISEDDKKTAIAAVPRFVAWLKTKPDHPAVHACRFLSQRRFEGFAAPTLAADNQPAWMKPPPGCQTHEEIVASVNGKAHDKTVGTEVRNSAGLDEDGGDRQKKLQLSG